MHRPSSKSRLSSTPEKTTNRKSFVSFTRRQKPTSSGSKMEKLLPKKKESSVNVETDILCYFPELRDQLLVLTLAELQTNLDQMKGLLKFQVI